MLRHLGRGWIMCNIMCVISGAGSQWGATGLGSHRIRALQVRIFWFNQSPFKDFIFGQGENMSRRNICFLEETGWLNFLWLHPLMRHLFLNSLNTLPNAWQKWMRTEAVGEYILHFSALCSIWVSRRMKFSRWILQSLKWWKTWRRWLTSMKRLCCMPWGGAMTTGWSTYVHKPRCCQHAGIRLAMSQPSLRWKKISSLSILIWGLSLQNVHWERTLLFSSFILLVYIYISLPTDIHPKVKAQGLESNKTSAF